MKEQLAVTQFPVAIYAVAEHQSNTFMETLQLSSFVA